MKHNSHQSLSGKTKEVHLATLIPLLTTALSIFTACSLAGDVLDTIKLRNRGSGEVALWVTQTTINDSIVVTLLKGNTSDFTGTFTGGPGAVIAYADKRPPTLEPMDWTDGIDTVKMRSDNIHRIRLSVWVVNGDFNTIRQRALNAKDRTSQIWSDERQGIAFKSFNIHDKTDKTDHGGNSVPDKFRSASFDCGRAGEIKDPINGIGFTQNVINVYYVETVNVDDGDLSTGGVYCGSDDLIALGADSDEALLAHELGHAFSLEHIDHLESDFDKTNVMHPASYERNFLTEGQTFRAIANLGSAINFLYKTRANPPQVECFTTVDLTEYDCPPIQKRIWRDGGENGTTWGPDE